MTRPSHRHHQGNGPPFTGLHTGRRRNPKAGMLIIHRPGEPDEVVTATEFRRRAQEAKQASPSA